MKAIVELCCAAAASEHVRAPLQRRRRVVVVPRAPSIGPATVRAITTPDEASVIAAARLRSEIRWHAYEAYGDAPPRLRKALDKLVTATTPTHRRRS